MADYTITAANVKPVDGTAKIVGPFQIGEASTPGQSVFRSGSDQKWYQLDVDNASRMSDISSKADSIGVLAFGGAALNDLAYIVTEGPIVAGTTLDVTKAVFGSDTAGGLKPSDDLDSGDVPVLVGVPLSTTVLYVKPVNPATALA
jgi:hypothetical protein